jgi:hypothetical protein
METNYAQLLEQYLHTARRVEPLVDHASAESLKEQVRILEEVPGEGGALGAFPLAAATSIDRILSTVEPTGAVAGILEEHKVQVQSITGRPPWLGPVGGISDDWPAGGDDGQR